MSDSLTNPAVVCPVFRSSHALHQSHQPERGLDDRRRHRHPHRGQLLRRPAGRFRHHAGVERGETAAALLSKVCDFISYFSDPQLRHQIKSTRRENLLKLVWCRVKTAAHHVLHHPHKHLHLYLRLHRRAPPLCRRAPKNMEIERRVESEESEERRIRSNMKY